MGTTKKGGARPKALDYKTVENLAKIGCSYREIAAVMGVALSTVQRRLEGDKKFKEAYDKGREGGKAGLRRIQWQLANDGNPTMAIWLGKQMLGQRDKQDQDITSKGEQIVIAGFVETGLDAKN